MKCYIVKDLLPEYIDGLTSNETDKEIEEHLKTCEECRKLMEAMKMPENTQIEHESVDYLKKIRSHMKLAVFAGIALCMVLFMAVRLLTSSPAAAPVANVEAAGSTVLVQGTVPDRHASVRVGKITHEGNSTDIELRTVYSLPFLHKDTWEVSIPAEKAGRITINHDTVVYEDGIMISEAANKIFHAFIPYAGDAPGVINLINAIGISYETIELQTEKEPYGLIIHIQGTMPQSIGRYATLLLGGIDNLSIVTFDNGAEAISFSGEDILARYQVDVTKRLSALATEEILHW